MSNAQYHHVSIPAADWDYIVRAAGRHLSEDASDTERTVHELFTRIAQDVETPHARTIELLEERLQAAEDELLRTNNSLHNALAMAGNAPMAVNTRFPDAPTFDGSKPSDLRTWILQLRNKLAAEPHRYTDPQSQLRYGFSRLTDAALNQVRSVVNVDTGHINLENLNALIERLKQAYDDPDRVRTANREIRQLRQKNASFVSYLSDFHRIFADLHWDEQAQKSQLYEGLSEEMKDALTHQTPVDDTLATYISLCKSIDTRLRARAEEKKRYTLRAVGTTPSSSRPASRPVPAQTTTTAHPSYTPGGTVPMDLSAADRQALRQRNREERIAKGLCLYCGQAGHLRLNCPARAAAEARRTKITANATTSTPSEPRIQEVNEPAEN